MDSSEHDKDDPAALDGLSLAEAFIRHVFCDPETEAIRPGADGAPNWSSHQPLAMDGTALAKAYYAPRAPRNRVRKMVRKGSEVERHRAPEPSQPAITAEMQRPFDCVALRFNQLIGWLRSGNPIAKGRATTSAALSEIDPMLWATDGYQIDIRNSTFLRRVNKAWNIEFHTVRLAANKPGRFASRKVDEYLKTVFSGERRSKADLKNDTMAMFPRLSARAFDTRWGDLAPDNWKKAGRRKNTGKTTT